MSHVTPVTRGGSGPADAGDIGKMGVAGIQTNRPDLLRQLADEMGVRLT
jgi:hypothetical protein